MIPDIISLDLQGTVSSAGFSDEFWLQCLPQWYARHHSIAVPLAKQELKRQFRGYGRYDRRYYDWRYWRNILAPGLTDAEVRALIQTPPHRYPDYLAKIKLWKQEGKAVIISSATTADFIEWELGSARNLFTATFSAIDDFDLAGKPATFYRLVAERMKVTPEQILHIGDDEEMDGRNAREAGVNAYVIDRPQGRLWPLK